MRNKIVNRLWTRLKTRQTIRKKTVAYTAVVTTATGLLLVFAVSMEQSVSASAEAKNDNLSVEACGTHVLSFRAEQVDNTVQVEWNIQKEYDKSNFILYRSRDGQVYFELARINAVRSAEGCPRYSYSDPHAPDGISYYRISQVDKDGKHMVFEPVAVHKTTKNTSVNKKVLLMNSLKNNIH